MIADTLRRYLDAHHARYHVHSHEPRFTAQETARVTHVPGKHFAKSVLLDVHDGRPGSRALAVLPATEIVDLGRMGRHIGYPVALATEEAFAQTFPGYEVGAAPPIADLAQEKIAVYVDSCLALGEGIAFNGGTHTDVVEMSWKEYARLTSPQIIECGHPAAVPPPASRSR